MLWEYAVIPGAFENNCLYKNWRANRAYYWGFENREYKLIFLCYCTKEKKKTSKKQRVGNIINSQKWKLLKLNSFEVLCLDFAHFSRLPAVKVWSLLEDSGGTNPAYYKNLKSKRSSSHTCHFEDDWQAPLSSTSNPISSDQTQNLKIFRRNDNSWIDLVPNEYLHQLFMNADSIKRFTPNTSTSK